MLTTNSDKLIVLVSGTSLYVHKIFRAFILFGIPEIELDLKTQAIEIDNLFIREFQVAGEQVDTGKGTGLEVGFGDDDHVDDLGKLMM